MKIPLIVGNWKMNLLASESKELASKIREYSEKIDGVRVVLAPSFTSLYCVRQTLLGSKVSLGSQNFYYQKKNKDTVTMNLHEWANAVEGNGEYRFTPEQILHNVQILDAIVTSAEKRESVDIK